jgi:hypothetical protein
LFSALSTPKWLYFWKLSDALRSDRLPTESERFNLKCVRNSRIRSFKGSLRLSLFGQMAADVDIAVSVQHGNPADVILAHADSRSTAPDLIVLAAHWLLSVNL